MKVFSLIISVLCICHFCSAQEEIAFTLNHDNEERNYILYIPASYDPLGKSFPLVFNFHGFTSAALAQREYSNMNPVADENDFIVCYPNGIDNAWNVNWNFGSSEDDLGFTEAMIENISASYHINLGKVYACGMSNGGFFSYSLACNMADKFAAVASVTGSFSPQMMNECAPSRKVPVMQIHGTEDAIVPYDGTNFTAEPIEEVIAFWLTHNICSADFDFTQFDDLFPDDNSTASQKYYTDCEDDSEVLFVTIDGGGHTWPNSPIQLPGTNLDYDASVKIWEFFDKHQIDELSSSTPIIEDRLSFYPNPASDYLIIEGKFNLAHIRDSKGQLLISSKERLVDVSFLTPGIYFISLQANDEVLLKKMLKH